MDAHTQYIYHQSCSPFLFNHPIFPEFLHVISIPRSEPLENVRVEVFFRPDAVPVTEPTARKHLKIILKIYKKN